MKRKIFSCMGLIALLCVVLSAVLSLLSAFGSVRTQLHYSVRSQTEAIYAALLRVEEPEEYLASIPVSDGDARVTLIGANGRVRYDSEAASTEMENHADRPEVQQALLYGHAEGERESDTLSQVQYYYAMRLPDQSVIRLSMDADGPWSALLRSLPMLIALLAGAFLVALLLSRFAAKRIVVPINAIDLDAPKDEELYDELAPLVRRIRRQHVRIEEQMEQLRSGKREFETVTENMNEGLVVLNKDARVISLNRSAKLLLDCPKDSVGRPFSQICRELPLQEMVENALLGAASEELYERRGRWQRVFADPVRAGDSTEGAILLFLDVTDQQLGEQMRREFSANVSHELKTPLTSISGYAELIEAGMAKPEDIAEFASIIHKEAKRLLALVEDIIALSRLDEGRNLGEKEPVELLELCRGVEKELLPEAQKRQVSLSVSGRAVFVEGIPSLLHEMVYNLVDNAVKYNREGGTVSLALEETPHSVALSVTDTGIGISEEHQPRVFERFYRVDKSHSRAGGGTGLGLSIVKHVAQYHGISLKLNSKPGKGTRVELSFPKVSKKTFQ